MEIRNERGVEEIIRVLFAQTKMSRGKSIHRTINMCFKRTLVAGTAGLGLMLRWW